MPPDRPDASGIETDIELNSSQDYNFEENAYTMNDKEKENASELADSNSTNECQSEIPRWDKSIEKNNQSDDELTSLSWLHQQNLLKGLDISDPSKDMKHENMLNNNICDDVADFSENTNSVSSLDDSLCPGKTRVLKYALRRQACACQVFLEFTLIFVLFFFMLSTENNGKTSVTLNGNGQNYQHPAKNCQKSTQIFQESAKSHCNISPSNQTKISLSNNNLPMSNRNKHPTHIPYDPHLHRNSKPPYSFSCLIFMAIEDSPVKALPVKEVYAWILEHFPYFRNAPTGWKNSVRHNLSLNKCFRKVEKAPVSV